jgi:translation initiation factor IF-2
MIVAINKIDMPESNPERVKAELLEHGVNCYEHGDVVAVEISAKKNININQLLEEILLMAEVYEFKADPHARPFAYVLESEVSRAGKGVWVIVKRGTLRKGQHFVVGSTYGTVQILRDHADRPAKEITPGRPGFVVYVESLPLPGEPLYVVESKKQAEELAAMFKRKKGVRKEKGITTLEKLSQMLKEHKIKKLKLILKADKMGTVNTLKAAIEKYRTKNEEAEAEVIYGGVGEVTRTDVELAASSGAVVIAFNVKVPQVAKKAAAVHGVQIRPYSVIYEVLDDVKQALLGLLSPERKRVLVGELEVLRVFIRDKKRVVFGGMVRKGEARRNAEIELVRNGEVVYKGKVSSLRRFQEDVKSVPEGQECGIAVADNMPVEEGDKVYFFDWVEEKPDVDYIVEKR